MTRDRHPLVVFTARRLGRLTVALLVVVIASFVLIHLVPGDPVRAALGAQAPPEVIAARTAELGLDRPLPQQFFDYVGGLMRGDLGTSLVSREEVRTIMSTRLPNTLALAGLAFALVVLIAIPAGLGMAVYTRDDRHPGVESGFTGLSATLGLIPNFVLATLLVAVFAVALRAVPVAGMAEPASYVLPVLSLALGPAALLARIVRVEGRKVLGEDYIRTARAKRLPARLIYLRHALPGMLTATLTVGGMLLPGMVAGTVLVENVFAWPGLGSQITGAVLVKDYPVAQAVVLLLGVLVLVTNVLVDLALAVLDPRSTIRNG
ncbi:peptide ABC transporter permease [Amycolatopsis orientalis]|uniref:Peptide ABC transporter permease n=1 Tax=Amycolatopsis orientalis TaxID=31958 RepID=A0A193BV40_AMYOR|nr:ABC transporter permease [Amycolatopsis orientalis]ANN16087.1 peptide ABC transporter permease [Amycolatopsis orientalis]